MLSISQYKSAEITTTANISPAKTGRIKKLYIKYQHIVYVFDFHTLLSMSKTNSKTIREK